MTRAVRSLARPMGMFVVALAALCGAASSAHAAGGLTREGRWFHYDGQPIYLVGYDNQSLAEGTRSWMFPDELYDYDAALEHFSDYGINKVRLWIYWYNPTDPTFHNPWASTVVDGESVFDLDDWDLVYWERLHDFVGKAESRQIMVELSIFSAYPQNPTWWSYQAWNSANNTNGVFVGNDDGTFWPGFYDMNYSENGQYILDRQRALVDKVILEMDRYKNVYYEIANEFAGEWNSSIDFAYPWQQAMADYIQERTDHPVVAHAHAGGLQHTDGIQYFWNQPSIDVLGFHFLSSDPAQVSALLHEAQVKGKTIQCNESWAWNDNLENATREAWAFFTSGGYYAFLGYDYLLPRIGNAEWQESAVRLRTLRQVAESVAFWQMSPVDEGGNEYDALVTQGPANWQVIANPGVEYVVYFWGDPSATAAAMSAPAGTYDYSWIDTRDGTELGSGSAASDGTVTIEAPDPAAWYGGTGVALVVRNQTAPTDHLAPAAPSGLTVR